MKAEAEETRLLHVNTHQPLLKVQLSYLLFIPWHFNIQIWDTLEV